MMSRISFPYHNSKKCRFCTLNVFIHLEDHDEKRQNGERTKPIINICLYVRLRECAISMTAFKLYGLKWYIHSIYNIIRR